MDSLDRRTLLLGSLGMAATALAACSGDTPTPAGTVPPPPSGTAAPVVTPPATPTAAADTRPRWPLTGRLVKDKGAAKRIAVAVKVPDNQNEHPQVGLDRADIVFVQLDGYRDASGYSGTRLMPVFHSRMPDGVAPVRSIRPVDIPLLSPINAVIGNTGATGWVLNYVKANGKHLEGMKSYMNTRGTGSYSIDGARVRTYQGVTYYDRAVVCHPATLAKQTKKFSDGPRLPYFPFATGDEEVSSATGKSARSIDVPWKSGHTYDMSYRYDKDSGKYLRSMPWGPHVLTNGTRVATDNVLVIRAKQYYDKIYRGGGHDEPIHEVIDARGTFYYFHGGTYVTGTWTKGAIDKRFSFTVADGSALKMAPGQTYVELARASAKLRIKG